jgi:hypothetical protein
MSSSPFDRILAASTDYLVAAAKAAKASLRASAVVDLPANAAPPAGGPAGLKKLTILDLDRGGGVAAQYNPRELQVDKAATWKQSETNNGNAPELEFTSTAARSMTLELFFDTLETDGGDGQPLDVHKTFIKILQEFLLVIDAKGVEEERRPPKAMVVWGDDLERFVGVFESVSVKYTMFMPGGRPVRATASVKLIEAERMESPKKKR